jgi:hypothetical protein
MEIVSRSINIVQLTYSKFFCRANMLEGFSGSVEDLIANLSLDNVTPADVYFGRTKEVLSTRAEIKNRTLQQRRLQNFQTAAV